MECLRVMATYNLQHDLTTNYIASLQKMPNLQFASSCNPSRFVYQIPIEFQYKKINANKISCKHIVHTKSELLDANNDIKIL